MGIREKASAALRARNPLNEWTRKVVRVTIKDKNGFDRVEKRYDLFHRSMFKERFETQKAMKHFIDTTIKPKRIRKTKAK